MFTYQGCKSPEAATGLPPVEMLDLSGNKIKLSDYSGKPLLINMWATWCGPCRFEIPMLNDFHKKYADDGLVVIGISTDDGDGAQLVKEFTRDVPIHYANFVKTANLEEKFGGVWALPTTYFYDRTGKQIDKIIGVQTPEYFEKQIQRILKN